MPGPGRLFPLCALLAALIFVPSCKEEKEKTLTLVGNIKVDGKSTDEGTNFFSSPIDVLLLSYLVSYDYRTDTYPPVLLKEAVPLEGGRVWDIRLREGVRFHDGTPVTAADAVFYMEKWREYYSNFKTIVRAEAKDAATLRLVLDAPEKDIRELMSFIAVLPGRLLEGKEDWRGAFLKNPVGSGPYRFKRWIGGGVELAANKDYFGGAPKIGRVVYLSEEHEERRLNRLLKGEADVMLSVSPRSAAFLAKDPKFRVNRQSFPYYAALFLNLRSDLFGDLRVRQALNMAVRRETVIEEAVGGAGEPVYSPFTKEMLPEGHVTPPAPYDPKRAAGLLAAAGWRPSAGGILAKEGRRFRIRLLYNTSDAELKKAADQIALQLYEIGIEMEMRGIGYEESLSPSKTAYDFLLTWRNASRPELVWRSAAPGAEASDNHSRYASREVDVLFDRGAKMIDQAEIRGNNALIEAIIQRDLPALFLYTPVYITAANRRFPVADNFFGTPDDMLRIKDWE